MTIYIGLAILIALGQVLEDQKPDLAEKCFRHVIELFPDHSLAVGSLASLLLKESEDTERVRATAKRKLSADSNAIKSSPKRMLVRKRLSLLIGGVRYLSSGILARTEIKNKRAEAQRLVAEGLSRDATNGYLKSLSRKLAA